MSLAVSQRDGERDSVKSIQTWTQLNSNVFGLWAYDSITALAKALAKMRITTIPKFKKADSGDNLTDLDAIGTS
ncbi:hypothetical protein BC332_16192 [Capsicum chinense]|nr:hypothetical protein BC332_16192 [Capsicum chinense]